MGVGLGIDIAMSNPQASGNNSFPNYLDRPSTKTGIMVPVFTDFRFFFPSLTATGMYIDVRLGASFLMNDKYLAVGNGFITNREFFYLKPSLGVRIPVKGSGKSAVDIGVTYQLLTANYWYIGSSHSTLNALGATVAFEW